MKKTYFILCILLVFELTKCSHAEKVEKRTVPVFSEIALNANATIHLSQGNDQLVEVAGDEELIGKLITEVRDRKLIIRYPDEEKFWSQITNRKKVEIKIIVSAIDVLEISGSGSILADDPIVSKNLNMRISGAGNIKLRKLESETVSSRISGTGNLFLAGPQTVAEFTSSISGTGIVKATDLPADNVEVSISGVGNCWVTANKKLNARVSGVGKIHYQGNADVKSRVSGMGSVSRIK